MAGPGRPVPRQSMVAGIGDWYFPEIRDAAHRQQGDGLKGFENARKLERLELDILLELRKTSPDTVRAFPVSIQQWGQCRLEVNGVYATNKGEFYFIDAGTSAGLTVRGLETRIALDLVNLMGNMGVVGNRTSLSELAFGDSAAQHPPASLPPPAPPQPKNPST